MREQSPIIYEPQTADFESGIRETKEAINQIAIDAQAQKDATIAEHQAALIAGWEGDQSTEGKTKRQLNEQLKTRKDLAEYMKSRPTESDADQVAYADHLYENQKKHFNNQIKDGTTTDVFYEASTPTELAQDYKKSLAENDRNLRQKVIDRIDELVADKPKQEQAAFRARYDSLLETANKRAEREAFFAGAKPATETTTDESDVEDDKPQEELGDQDEPEEATTDTESDAETDEESDEADDAQEPTELRRNLGKASLKFI